MPMTTAWRNKVGDHLLNKADIGAPANLWIGVSVSNPGDAGSYAGEPSGGGYDRVNVTASFGSFAAGTGADAGYSVATNTALVSLGSPSGGDWTGDGEQLAYVTYSKSETGTGADDMIYYEEIPRKRTALDGSKAVAWRPGELKIKHR